MRTRAAPVAVLALATVIGLGPWAGASTLPARFIVSTHVDASGALVVDLNETDDYLTPILRHEDPTHVIRQAIAKIAATGSRGGQLIIRPGEYFLSYPDDCPKGETHCGMFQLANAEGPGDI